MKKYTIQYNSLEERKENKGKEIKGDRERRKKENVREIRKEKERY